MTFFRQTIAPFVIVLIFIVALVAVSARIFLPSDMAQPAPVHEISGISSPIVPD
jgi:hypothetical protein